MFFLSPRQRQQIIRHAERTYPEECCGILLGTIDRQTNCKTLTESLETQNAWNESVIAALSDLAEVMPSRRQEAASRRDRYWIDPQDLLKAQKSGRDRGLQVIGIYHSHPDHPAIPSECDRLLAWAEYTYVIVSVSQRSVLQSKLESQSKSQISTPHHGETDFQCWTLNEQHQFLPETIAIAMDDTTD
jgi:proteasome lid subunit RPN8/RPN11